MKEDNDAKTLRSILREMGENCTIHGVPRIVSAKHPFFRIIWICLFLGVNGYLIFQLYNVFVTYYSWPVKTTVSLEFSKLQFPAVTFCNMNPIRRSKLQEASFDVQNIINPDLSSRRSRKKRSVAGSEVVLNSSVSSSTSLYEYTINATPASQYTITPTATEEVSVESSSQVTEYNATSISPSFGMPESPDENLTCVTEDGSTYTEDKCSTSVQSISSSYANFWEWQRDATIDEDGVTSSDSRYASSGYSAGFDYYNEWGPEKDKWQNRLEKFLTAFQKQDTEIRYDIGHSINDMLMSCSFATKVCYSENFTRFQTSEYGNCYTIQSEKFTTRRTGPLYGMWLTINLEKLEYITNFADAYGIKLIIHEPGTFPFPAEEGITINPNHETTIGLKMINISRQGHPYGQCEKGEQFKKNFGIRYTVPACVKLCKQRKVLEECECLSQTDIDTSQNKETINDDVRVCRRNIKDLKCQEQVELKYSDGQLDCFCESPCEEIVYEKTLSGRQWPNDEYMRYSLVYDLCKKMLWYKVPFCRNYQLSISDFDVSSYRDNFLRVIIYYEDLNYEIIKEDPLYDSFQFMSDIGGTLGLFIGASILSLFETLQLLLEIIYFLKNKWIKPTNFNKITDSQVTLGQTLTVKSTEIMDTENKHISQRNETFNYSYEPDV